MTRFRGRSADMAASAEPDKEPAVADPAQLRRRIRQLEATVETLESDLRARMDELEDGLQEQRILGARVAELGDLVAGVIGAAARGSREEFEQALADYADGI